MRDEIEFTQEESNLFFVLIGERPPSALYNLAFESNELFQQFGEHISELRHLITDSLTEVRGALPEGVVDEYVQAMSILTGTAGGMDYLGQFAHQLSEIAGGQILQSQQIMQGKIEMIFELALLLIHLAFMAALAYFTGGLSLGQMALARARTRFALLTIMYQFLHRTHLLPGISEAIEEALVNFASQLTMLGANRGKRRPRGINWKDVGTSALFGYITGTFISGIGGIGDRFKGLFKDRVDSKVLRTFSSSTWNAGAEGFGEGLGETVTSGLLYGKWGFNFTTVGGGAVSSLTTDPLFKGGHDLGMWAHKFNAVGLGAGAYNSTSRAGQDIPHGTGDTPGVDPDVTSGPGPVGAGPTPLPNLALFAPTTFTDGGSTSGGTTVGGETPVNRTGSTLPHSQSPIAPPTDRRPYDTEPQPAADHIVTSRTELDRAPDIGTTPLTPGDSLHGGDGRLTAPSDGDPGEVAPYPHGGTRRESSGFGTVGAASSGSRTGLPSDDVLSRDEGVEFGGDDARPSTAGAPPRSGSPVSPESLGRTPQPSGPEARLRQNPQELYDGSLHETDPEAAPTGVQDPAPAVTDANASPETPSEPGSHLPTAAASPTPTPSSTTPHPATPPSSATTGATGGRTLVHPVGEGEATDPTAASEPQARTSPLRVEAGTLPVPHQTPARAETAFDWRTFEFDGQSFADVTVDVEFINESSLPQADVDAVWGRIEEGIQREVNAHGHVLPEFGQLRVTVQPAAPGSVPHLRVELVGPDSGRQMSPFVWRTDATPEDFAQQIGDLLGLWDDATASADPAPTDTAASVDPVPVSTGTVPGALSAPAPPGSPRPSSLGPSAGFLADTEAHALETSEEQPIRVSTQSNDPAGASIAPSEPQPVPAVSSVPRAAAPVVTVSDPSPTNTETAPVTAAAQAPPGDPVPRSNDTESLPSTVSRTHTFVAPSMDAVPYGAWAHRRATAPVATVRTAPQAGPDSRATGRRTGPAPGTSTKVRRIEAGFGRWVRDLTVALPVTFGTGTHPGDLGILQQRITRLLGDHINTGFVLPGSQDQLHVGVELIESSAEAGAVELTRASEPGGSDQPRLQLRAAQDDQDMLRDDSMLLHEILRHVGVTNRYRDTTALFRSPSEEVDATSRRLPGSYLTQIETATDVGRVLPDAPLPVTAESSDAFGQPSAPVPAPATGAAGVSRVDRLDSVRPYGTNPGQLQRPSPEDQHRLESVFPRDRRGFQRFPDPRGNTFRLAGPIRALNRVRRRNSFATDMGSADWVQRINGRWQDSAPRSASRQRLPNVPRLANCIDVARSVLLSWHGHPTVAAAVVQPPDSVAVETNGPPRTSEWLGTRWRHHDHRSDAPGSASQQAWSAVAERLQAHGHGSSAIVVFRPGRTIHAVNAVNYGGRIYWIDAQRGRVSPDPLYTGESFMSIELDPHFNPIDPLPVLQRFTGRPAETAPASYADLQWAAALEQTAHGSPDQENALEPLPDTHGAQDTQIVENWLSESALRRVRRSAALRVVDASVREWMATGRDRSADGADETSRRQLAAIQRSIADWKAAKSGRSARMSAVDRLLAQVTSLLDGIAGRPADAVEQQRESLPPRTLDRPAPQTFAGPPVPVVNVPSDAPLVSGTYHRDSSLITLADQGRGGPGLRTAPQTAQFIRRNTTWNAGDPAVLNAAGTGEPGPSGEPSFAAQVAFHLSGPVYAPATDGEWLRHDPTAADQIPPTPAMVTGTDPEPPADVPDTPGSRTSAADGAGRAGAADPSALTTHATGAQGSVWRLPPYLERMDSAGLATLHELDSSGLDWITTMIESATGPGSAGQIRDDLANQPSAFIGRGRAYQVVGSNGWFDVVVSLRADSGRARPTVTLPTTENDGSEWGPRSWAEITSGAANVSVSGRTRGLVVRGTGTVLAPTPTPGVLAGASVNVNAGYGIRTVKDARAAQVAEADRVVSAQGTIDVARRMRWHLRIARAGQGPARHFWGQTEGTLRVPVADLVPLDAPRPESRAVTPDESRRIALSPSMSVVAADSGHLYQGGGGLLDAIASQLHPSLIGAGAPGRTEVLQAATSQALSHALRRMLTGWVTSPDLASSDGKVAGSFRVTAEITAVSPVPGAVPDPGATGDGSGETAADGTFSPGSTLKPRQKAVTAHSTTLGRSSNVVAMGGPGVGAGVMEGGPLARVFVQPGGEWSRSRFVRTSRALALKQGVDVGGDNVLYAADVLVHVQATGPTPPAQRAGRSARSGPARARVWFRLSLVEAAELDLPLPAGVTKPARLFANPGFERMMPAGPAGASVSLTGLDSGRLQASIEETFRKDPRLAGILPSWGHRELDEQRNWRVSDADQARMRHNSRALTDTLSPANLQTHKAQLLTTGVFVRLVRKRWDVTQTVQVRVTGRIIPDTVRHLGDRADRDLVVSAALAEGAASGQSTETGGVLIARGNAKPVPGHLYLTGFGGYISTAERANRAGPKFAAGFESEGMSPAAHWDGTIEFDVEITSVERQRTLHRSLLPGTPGRHQPQVRTIARSRRPEPGTPGPAVPSAGDSVTPMALVSETVRFTSPAGFTLRQPVQLPASTKPQPIDVPFALGISSLLDPAWRASAATAVPEWLLLESTHSGADVLEMARDLLARAATHADSALSTAGLDPALKIEDTFNPEATGMGLRIGTGQVWIVDNLRFPRRLNSLHGAVGAQFHVVAPRVVAVVDAPPVETFVSGGHVASSERASARGWVGGLLVQGAGDLAPDHWAIAGPGYMRVGVKAKERSAKTSGSVTRVAVSAPGGPAVLVSADLEVLMVAEVSTGHNPPRVETDGQRLRGAVLAWLTEDQARRLGLGEQLDEHLAKAAGPASGVASVDATTTPETAWPESTSAPAHRADESAPSEPTPNRFLHDSGPLGLGHIDHLPAFDRLLPALRQELDRLRGPDFRRNLLPDVLIQDRFRNTQRLMQVLGSIGSRSLLTGAMDGGVAVPLHARDGSVAYVARFTVTRSAGRFTGPATGRRMMMHVTGAGAETATAEVRVSQSAPLLFGLPMERLDAQHEGPRGAASGNEFSVLGSAGLDASERGREESGGVIVGTPHDAPAAEIVFLIEAAIELYSPGRPGEAPPVATVQLPAPAAGEDDRYLRFRMPHSDLNSLARIGPAREPSGSVWQPVALSEQLARWRQSGTAIPEEAQVNNFQGAPVVRAALADLVRGLGAMPAFTRAGEPASWVLEEALATEWLISALPQLAATGAQLPEAYVPHWLGGDDLRVTADARFTQGQV
ncbi:toxin glutamine deamidase domain-containing protein, partial [Streptomyces sp. NPDC006654]|uniref:toxin glutamine deamidase domain-containing protein n=1 Tax=Streptomyces sp. NPDC006654 TaxID=3156897 RepID=UPI0033D05745